MEKSLETNWFWTGLVIEVLNGNEISIRAFQKGDEKLAMNRWRKFSR